MIGGVRQVRPPGQGATGGHPPGRGGQPAEERRILNAMKQDARFLQGIAHFNRHEFFEAHEVWEDLWRETSGESRRFYQGLIQAAVALHHYRNGNFAGAGRLWAYCVEHLEPYRPGYQGVDLESFLRALEGIFENIYVSNPPGLDPSRIPSIPPPEA